MNLALGIKHILIAIDVYLLWMHVLSADPWSHTYDYSLIGFVYSVREAGVK